MDPIQDTKMFVTERIWSFCEEYSIPDLQMLTDDVLDAAIDLAIDRANKALRRLHDKVVSHQKGTVKDLETLDA